MTLVVCAETGPGVFRRLVRELLEFLKEMSVGKDALVAERGLGPRCQVCTLDSRPGTRGGWVEGSAAGGRGRLWRWGAGGSGGPKSGSAALRNGEAAAAVSRQDWVAGPLFFFEIAFSLFPPG